MKAESLISVILPCYGMGEYVGEALSSVARQTHTEWEIIAVDDLGPEDGTRSAVEKFAAQQPQQRVEYLRLPENRGPGGARNAGVGIARGRLLAFLDPDDLWQPDHLARHIEARTGLDASLVTASRITVFRGGNISDVICEMGFTEWERKAFPLSLAMWNPMPPSCVVVDRASFDAVKGFDETPELRMADDWDLWLRLVDAGADFRFVNEATVLYRQHAGGATSDRAMMRKRAGVFAQRNADSLQLKISHLTHMLGERVDGLEARLNHLQGNPIVRLISALGSLFRKQGK